MNTIPTPEQLAAIKAKCDMVSTPYENWIAINGEMVPNPILATMVPKRMVGIELFKILTADASKQKIADWVVLPKLVDCISAQDHTGILEWLQVAAGTGKISPAEFQAATKYVTDRRDGIEVRPDPTWPPKVPWPIASPLFGEPIPFMWVVEAIE